MSMIVHPGWVTILIFLSCDERSSRLRYFIIESRIMATFFLTHLMPLIFFDTP